MVKVKLKKLTEGNVKTSQIVLPTTWGDLTAPQVWVVADLLLSSEPYKAKFELLKFCIEPHIFKYLDEFQIGELGNCLDFLLKTNTLTKNHFPQWKGLFGPADFLTKTTVNEYARADNHFRKFIKTQSIEELDLLTACLYRPPKRNIPTLRKSESWNGDYRQRYNPDAIGTNLKKVRKLPTKLKCATFLFFMGCKQKFVDMFPFIFPKNAPNDGKQGNWADTKLDLAEARVFGNLKETGETFILDALVFLNKKAKEAKEAEKNL